MTTLEKFQEVANIEFVEYNGYIEIGTLPTADGYDLYYIGTDVQNLNWENEVYYYQPEFDTIMAAIEELRYYKREIVSIVCYDVEDWFDEYDMLNYLQKDRNEKEFEKFTNEEK
jgi:hypothetical protein